MDFYFLNERMKINFIYSQAKPPSVTRNHYEMNNYFFAFVLNIFN